jgi:hypothetical protein
MATLKLPDICATCNNGWMSRLENLTKPFLLLLIRGEQCQITDAVRRQIAAWVQLKGITLDAFYEKEYGSQRHLPGFVAHEFCQRVQPLPGGVVILGDIEPFPVGSGLPFGRRMIEAPLPQLGGAKAKYVRATFAFNHLFVQTTIGGIEETGDLVHAPAGANGRLLRIWPPQAGRDIQWPSGETIPRNDFSSLT